MRRAILLWCVVATVFAATAASANLISNGSFEEGVVIPTDPGYVKLSKGSTAITGWEVTLGSIDYIGNYWTASDGARSIDLNGSGKGAITGPFFTELYIPYLLEFDLAGNPAGPPRVKTVQVTVTGGAGTTPIVQSFTFDTTGKGLDSMGWVTKSVLFNGFGADTEITFASLNITAYGAALDNVRVNSAVPEPMSLLLGIMGLSSVAGFRKLRRK